MKNIRELDVPLPDRLHVSSRHRNVCLWDTLVTPAYSLVHGKSSSHAHSHMIHPYNPITLSPVCDPAFSCHDSGATVLALASKQQLLISGGRKGWISVLDLSLKVQRQSFQAHDSPVKALAVDATEGSFISGSAEGNIKVRLDLL